MKKHRKPEPEAVKKVKLRVAIDQLQMGMFVEADVVTRRIEGEMRHFLEARDAVFAESTNKKARLTRRKHEQVLHAGGMLLSSEKQIEALRETGLAIVVVNTDKCDDVPGLEELIAQAEAQEEAIASIEDRGDALSKSAGSKPSATIWLEDLARIGGSFPDEEPEPRPKSTRFVDVPPTERRKNFGSSKNGWMKVETTGEGERAFMQVLSFGGDSSLSKEDVFEALEEQYGIRENIDRKLIERLTSQASSSPNRVIRGQFLVADAAPVADAIGHIDYTFLEDLAVDVEELSYVEMREALGQTRLEDVLDSSLFTRLVAPGEQLAVFKPADEVLTGLDIFGNPRQGMGAESLLEAGRNVLLDDHCYLSEIYGYVCLVDGELSVLSPIWMAPDRMEARLIYLPQAGPATILIRDWLMHLIEVKGVTHGIRELAIEFLLDEPLGGPEPASYLLAQGTAPGRGEDVRVEYASDLDEGAGLPDWRGGVEVSANQLLARIYPVKEGRSGIGVTGEKVQGIRGEGQAVMPGHNVRSEQRDGMEVLYAEMDGVVRIARGVLAVKAMVRFKGDVNQNVGTVEKDKDVFISGSVGSNFAINAGGSVTIDGVVKAGASIRAQEDVIAAKGIVGSQTRVVSLGNVETSFVQGSSIVAHGDVTVGSHLLNACVRAGGQITVGTNGGERSGSIAGGQVYSSTGIEADKVRDAVLGVGPGLEIVAQLRKLDESINFCKSNVLRIFRTLKLKEIDVVHFKAYIESCSPDKRAPMMRILEQLKSLAATRDQSLRKHQELQIEQERKLEEAEINISGHVSAGVLVRMGDETLTVTEDLPRAAFHKTADGISWGEGG